MTQTMRIGQLPQTSQGLVFGAVHAVHLPKLTRLQVVAAHQRHQWAGVRVLIQPPGAQGAFAAQLAVQERLHRFDKPRLQQKRTQLARRLHPLHTADLLRNPHLPRLPSGGLEVRHHAAAQFDAFADVERDLSRLGRYITTLLCLLGGLAIEQIHPCRLGHVCHIRLQIRRQGGAALHQELRLLADGVCAKLPRRHLQKALHQVHITHGAVAG